MKSVTVTEVPDEAQLIDVREPDEYAAGHAQHAINICLSGGRSARVCEYLDAHDIACINVEGGTSAWEAAGLPMS